MKESSLSIKHMDIITSFCDAARGVSLEYCNYIILNRENVRRMRNSWLENEVFEIKGALMLRGKKLPTTNSVISYSTSSKRTNFNYIYFSEMQSLYLEHWDKRMKSGRCLSITLNGNSIETIVLFESTPTNGQFNPEGRALKPQLLAETSAEIKSAKRNILAELIPFVDTIRGN